MPQNRLAASQADALYRQVHELEMDMKAGQRTLARLADERQDSERAVSDAEGALARLREQIEECSQKVSYIEDKAASVAKDDANAEQAKQELRHIEDMARQTRANTRATMKGLRTHYAACLQSTEVLNKLATKLQATCENQCAPPAATDSLAKQIQDIRAKLLSKQEQVRKHHDDKAKQAEVQNLLDGTLSEIDQRAAENVVRKAWIDETDKKIKLMQHWIASAAAASTAQKVVPNTC